ncbi:MAG: class I SAM-dependent methyltransferase [Anaerolineaceae bacterium]|nr:class I SAM-dependent methyltransferase [Anaerolineaceae bacterium]
MDRKTFEKVLEINRKFYQDFGEAFAVTRRRIQPGIRSILESLPRSGNWLDVGCGSGALAQAWKGHFQEGLYLGIDFSLPQLELAQLVDGDVSGGVQVEFLEIDLSSVDWVSKVRSYLQENGIEALFDGIVSFAVLHHIPDCENRLRLLKNIRSFLAPGSLFVHSVWQFQHSERLMARRQDWNSVGLSQDMVEQGDYLLDWRRSMPGQKEKNGLRYVHLYDRKELAELADLSGFAIIKEFESDGEGGRLGLYQFWQAV